jgi:hypothetical protein
VDNSACYFGWLNRNSSNDEMASIMIRALHLISAALGSQIHIRHLPRQSNWEARLVDRLSRSETTTKEDKRLVESFTNPNLPVSMKEWLRDPVEDWELPLKLLKYVENKLQNI